MKPNSLLVRIQFRCGDFPEFPSTLLAKKLGRAAKLFLSPLSCSNHLAHLTVRDVPKETPFVGLSLQLSNPGYAKW
jgi:hypothetical protein